MPYSLLSRLSSPTSILYNEQDHLYHLEQVLVLLEDSIYEWREKYYTGSAKGVKRTEQGILVLLYM